MLFRSPILIRFAGSALACLSLTACTFDLDDPFGIKQRRAYERYPECQQVYNLVDRYTEDSLAAYEQNLSAAGLQTEAGLLAEAEVSRHSAEQLLALDLGDEDLEAIGSQLAARLQETERVRRELAPLAEAEPSSERDKALQAAISRRNEANRRYAGGLRELEHYCEGGELNSALRVDRA